MTKDPTPRADALRAQREARYGHLQAKADIQLSEPVTAVSPIRLKAGTKMGTGVFVGPYEAIQKSPRKRVKHKRKTK